MKHLPTIPPSRRRRLAIAGTSVTAAAVAIATGAAVSASAISETTEDRPAAVTAIGLGPNSEAVECTYEGAAAASLLPGGDPSEDVTVAFNDEVLRVLPGVRSVADVVNGTDESVSITSSDEIRPGTQEECAAILEPFHHAPG